MKTRVAETISSRLRPIPVLGISIAATPIPEPMPVGRK